MPQQILPQGLNFTKKLLRHIGKSNDQNQILARDFNMVEDIS